jgi:hypothetical protein
MPRKIVKISAANRLVPETKVYNNFVWKKKSTINEN